METKIRNEQQMFDESISILVTAFLKDELQHANCEACAVANLMRGKGCKFKDAATASNWLIYLEEEVRKSNHYYDPSIYSKDEAIAQIQSTGYTVFEVHLIEEAFETAPYDFNLAEENHIAAREKWMFDGLMSVVECLAMIHKVDLSIKESAKLQFVKS